MTKPGWLIAAPVWGPAYVDRFINAALPAQLRALEFGGVRGVRWIVHTDQRHRIEAAMDGLDVAFMSVPPRGDLYQKFGDAHRAALDIADPGEYVALLSADIVVSQEAFAACEARFVAGKRAVVCAATRTLGPTSPPIGAVSRDLLEWTMRHPHPMVQECFWGNKSRTPWAIYFRHGDAVTLRAFHLHPLAVVKDRELPFKGTLDIDLLDNFSHDEIHVVTDPNELSCAEMSPPERYFRAGNVPMSIPSIAQWASTRASPLHWWISTHRIVIRGHGKTDDAAIWDQVLDRPENPLRVSA